MDISAGNSQPDVGILVGYYWLQHRGSGTGVTIGSNTGEEKIGGSVYIGRYLDIDMMVITWWT